MVFGGSTRSLEHTDPIIFSQFGLQLLVSFCLCTKISQTKILWEFHRSHFAMHPGGTKMYHDLHRQYYWSGMKQQVGDFVRRCLTCQ